MIQKSTDIESVLLDFREKMSAIYDIIIIYINTYMRTGVKRLPGTTYRGHDWRGHGLF